MKKFLEITESGELCENGERRRSIICGLLGISLSSVIPACVSLFESQVYELNRNKNIESFTSDQLGFIKNETVVLEAFRKMKKLDITGIVKDDCTLDNGSLLQALAADYQKQVHIFMNNRYFQSVELHSDGMETHGFGVGIGTYGDNMTALFAAYRDKERKMQPRMDIFLNKGDSFVYSGGLKFEGKIKKDSGFALPYFVGHDLKNGMLLLGRNRDGTVWKKIPRIKITDDKLKIDEIPLSYAARCSCTMDYIKGNNIGLGEMSEDNFLSSSEE